MVRLSVKALCLSAIALASAKSPLLAWTNRNIADVSSTNYADADDVATYLAPFLESCPESVLILDQPNLNVADLNEMRAVKSAYEAAKSALQIGHFNTDNVNNIDAVVNTIAEKCSNAIVSEDKIGEENSIVIKKLSGVVSESQRIIKNVLKKVNDNTLVVFLSNNDVVNQKLLVQRQDAVPTLTDVVIKASQLHVGPSHAVHLANAVGKAPNVAALDLAANDLGDDGISALCSSVVGLGPQAAIKRLNISANLSSEAREKGQRRNNPKAVAAIMALLSSEVPLEALSLRGGRGPAQQPSPSDCCDIIYTLACKEAKLQELDLMGCGMGNRGAVALGQMLQVNKSLRKLTWDHNNVTVSGYRAFVKGLECNRTLKVMPLPVKDLEAAMAASPEGNAVLQRIQSAMSNIQNPQKLDMSVSFGSTGIITQDGRQDVLEKEVANLRRIGSQSEGARAALEEPDTQTLLDDCTRVQQMGSSFQFMREEIAGLLEQEMVTKLQNLSKDFVMVVASMKSQLANKMSEFISQTFKTIDSDTARRLRIAIDYGTKMFDHVSLDKILVAAAGQEIQSGASECFNSAVDLAMDYVYDKLMDAVKSAAVNLESAQLTEGMEDIGVTVTSTPVSTPRHEKKDKKKEEKKEKKEKKKEEKKEEEPKEEEKEEEPKEEEPKEEEKEEEEAPATTPTSAPPASPSGGLAPSRRPPPVPGKKPPPGRLAKPNGALAAALAAGPMSPSRRPPVVRKPVEEEAAAPATPTTPATPATEEKDKDKDKDKKGHRLLGRKEKTPAVKPTKTREISYKVSGNETVLGVAVANNTESTPALTHPTKDRARGPAGRKGGARRPPSHKKYTLTDPTAQLQPTML